MIELARLCGRYALSIGRTTTHADRPVTDDDRGQIYDLATSGFEKRDCHLLNTGMTGDELRRALVSYLGIFGGSGGQGNPSICYSGSGLKIWGAWRVVNHIQEALCLPVRQPSPWCKMSIASLIPTTNN